MASMTVEQKRVFNKLKHDFEPWRNLLVHLDSILKWDKPYYPAAIFGTITFFYLILWELNLSIITLLALIGLTVLAFDYGYPVVSRMIFKNDNWSGKEEESYEHIIQQIASIKMTTNSFYDFWFNNKERKSTMIVAGVSITLLLLAWIGATFDNMFLMYILTLSIALLPGIMQKSVVENFRQKLCTLLKAQVQQIRQRSECPPVKAD